MCCACCCAALLGGFVVYIAACPFYTPLHYLWPYPSGQCWRLLYQGEEVTGDVVETIKTVAVQKQLDAYVATKAGQLAGGRVEWQ
eukprot:5483841-Pyramimonas_sp.AAC.1